MKPWLTAVVLGIVEGLTEFVPVSSTGHLIVAGSLLGFTGEKASSFQIAIQLGAILSVVFLYWKRFVGLIPRASKPAVPVDSTLEGWSGLWRIGLATLPILAVGFLAHDFVKARLFTPTAVAWALTVGGFAILIAEKLRTRATNGSLDALTWRQALGIGLFQTLSLWPGTSRSAATIVGGLLLGLDRKAAAEFSFLIAVPTMTAATGYETLKMASTFSSEELGQFAVGFIVSFIFAAASITAFIRFLSRWSLAPFAWYRIAAGPIFYLLTRGLNG
jgi:undecaprenyl-diphosphatase